MSIDSATAIRRIRAHLAAVEQLLSQVTAQVPEQRRPRRVPEITESEFEDRWNLWNTYWRLKCEEITGQVFNKRKGDNVPTSQAHFAAKMGVNASELSRWMKRRGIASGSSPDLSIRRALNVEIERLNIVLSQRTEKIPIGG